MADVPERYRELEERTGLKPIGTALVRDVRRALRRSIVTMDDAYRLVEATREALGERGWLDPEGGEIRDRLYERDETNTAWVVPTPLVERRRAGDANEAVIARIKSGEPTVPEDGEPNDTPVLQGDLTPEIVPAGPTMHAGRITLAEGAIAWWYATFDARGVRDETHALGGDFHMAARHAATHPYMIDPSTRPRDPAPISLMLRGDLNPNGHDISTLAAMVAEMKPHQRMVARVCTPVPIPGGPANIWAYATAPIGALLQSGDIPESARWLVIDAFDFTAFAFAADRGAALAAWQRAVWQHKPGQPKTLEADAQVAAEKRTRPDGAEPKVVPLPTAPASDPTAITIGLLDRMQVEISPPSSAVELPRPIPQNVPAVLVPLPPLPSVPARFADAGFRRWVRVIDRGGQIRHALRRDDSEDAFTLVGEGVLDLVDLATLDDELDEAALRDRRKSAEMFPPSADPWLDATWRYRYTEYKLWDPHKQRRVPFFEKNGAFGGEAKANLSGNTLPWRVARLCRHAVG